MNKLSFKPVLAACLMAVCAQGVQAATMEEMEKRLKALETEVELNREIAEDAAAAAMKGIRVSGYSTLEYVMTDKANTNNNFRLRHFNLMFNNQISKNLKFFSSVMLEDAPLIDKNTSANGTGGKILVEAVNFNYAATPTTTIRAGRFFTPAGIWSLDSIPFVMTQDRPLHIRNIFPHVVDGLTVGGVHALGGTTASYDVYVGNGQTNQFDGGADYNSDKAMGVKVNVALPVLDRLELGATSYRERMMTTKTATEEDKNAMGVHFQAKQGMFTVRGEYAKATYAPAGNPAGNYDRTGYYVQPALDIGKYTVGYRYDYYDAKSTTNGVDATAENVPFVAYHVDKNTTLKWEHHLVNQLDAAKQDYYRSILSVAVNFE